MSVHHSFYRCDRLLLDLFLFGSSRTFWTLYCPWGNSFWNCVKGHNQSVCLLSVFFLYASSLSSQYAHHNQWKQCNGDLKNTNHWGSDRTPFLKIQFLLNACLHALLDHSSKLNPTHQPAMRQCPSFINTTIKQIQFCNNNASYVLRGPRNTNTHRKLLSFA